MTTEDTERAKYRKAWALPQYRTHSPGLRECEAALAGLRPKPGESLIDYGAGTGRATAWWRDRGLNVLAVDMIPEALEEAVPFREACLWSMPADIGPADYGYCCDVMEHIPPEHVDAVLSGIALRTRKAAWLRIALFDDKVHRRQVGAKLHLTVQPARWWGQRLARTFEQVELVRATPYIAAFLCLPNAPR